MQLEVSIHTPPPEQKLVQEQERELPRTLGPATSIPAQIAAHAAAAPGRTAVADGTDRLTYAELERQSNQLAAHLREQGAGPECCVGLLLERSAAFVVAALAVLKTGAAYLPLDPSTPLDRVALILGDAGASVLLTHRGKARDLRPGAWRVDDLDSLDAAPTARRPARDTGVEVGVGLELAPSSLAYIVYTSGSTGRPKGVEITHANLENLVQWHRAAFRVTAADRASQLAGLGFDAVAWEIWPHLTAGASLHIADEPTRRSPQALRDWLLGQRITLSFVPTVLAEQLLQVSWPATAALRTLLTGADRLYRRPPPGLPFVVVNNYGPTECTVVATSGTVAPDGAAGPPSIGRPIANTTTLILDEALRPVSPGEVGELCLAGALVGRGYRNNRELTALSFVTHVPESGPPLRVYRTGDRARLLEGGEIEFLGRLDDQVKIRGYRIEPGEIAFCLDLHPNVAASAVVVQDAAAAHHERGGADAAASDPVLVAYVVAARDTRLTASELREFLSVRLPDYMIPAQFVALATLPVTSNGKLDRSALPPPGAENLLLDGATAATPVGAASGSDVEEQVAVLVASLLGHASIGREDNFFMAGGHSMLGVQLLSRIRDKFDVKLSLRQLFKSPTVAALSAAIAGLIEDRGSGSVPGK